MQKILIPILGLFQSPQRTSQYFNIQNNYILVVKVIVVLPKVLRWGLKWSG